MEYNRNLLKFQTKRKGRKHKTKTSYMPHIIPLGMTLENAQIKKAVKKPFTKKYAKSDPISESESEVELSNDDDEPDEVIRKDDDAEDILSHTSDDTVSQHNEASDSEEEVKTAIAATTTVKNIVVTPAEVATIIDDAKFWDTYVKPLNWRESDESKRTKTYVLAALPSDRKRAELRAAITSLVAPIKVGLADNPEFTELIPNAQNNFLAHIIGKGEGFYNMVVECPMLALYLLEKNPATREPKYQNLWDYLE